MSWRPEPILNEKQVDRAMKLVIADGLASEASDHAYEWYLSGGDACNAECKQFSDRPAGRFTHVHQCISVAICLAGAPFQQQAGHCGDQFIPARTAAGAHRFAHPCF